MKKTYDGQGDWQAMGERAKLGRIGRRRVSWEVFCFSRPTKDWCGDMWLGLGLLWTWDCGGCLCYFYHEARALGGYYMLRQWILLQRHSQNKEVLCFLTLPCSEAALFLIVFGTILLYLRNDCWSGININSSVNILTTCTAVQVTEMKTTVWKLWEELSFCCIFGHRVSLSQVQLLAVPLGLQEA